MRMLQTALFAMAVVCLVMTIRAYSFVAQILFACWTVWATVTVAALLDAHNADAHNARQHATKKGEVE